MRTRSITALAVGLVAVLALGGSPAGAGTELGPEIVDQAGDANFINGNGFVLGLEQSTPVDIGSADITKIWFETGYDTVTEVDESGTVTAVRHVPNALLVKIKTAGPAPIRPSFGPTLIYRVPAKILTCEVWFEAYVKGPASSPGDTAERADIRKPSATGCPGGAQTLTAGFSLSSSGSVLTMKFPFSALPYASNQIVLGKDVEIRPIASTPHVRTAIVAATAPEIDWTESLEAKFLIGSDVPQPVDCVTTPDGHTLCPNGTQSQTG